MKLGSIEKQMAQLELILSSYQRLLGRSLVDPIPNESDDLCAQRVFHAPFVLVSHGTEADPLFNYGNAVALQLWEFELAEFIGLPSRYSAEPAERHERERLLSEVAKNGFSANYTGVRASRSGRRFRIENATVWNLTNELGSYMGQAATFSQWTFLAD